jgi:hypothetical protein
MGTVKELLFDADREFDSFEPADSKEAEGIDEYRKTVDFMKSGGTRNQNDPNGRRRFWGTLPHDIKDLSVPAIRERMVKGLKRDFLSRVEHYRNKDLFFGGQGEHGIIAPTRFRASQDESALETTAFGGVDALLDKHGKGLAELLVDTSIHERTFQRIREKALKLNPQMKVERW